MVLILLRHPCGRFIHPEKARARASRCPVERVRGASRTGTPRGVGGGGQPPRLAAADWIVEANVLTSVYTPGKLGRAQPLPQLVMPTWIHALLASRRNIGPPESPWQVSTPPEV